MENLCYLGLFLLKNHFNLPPSLPTSTCHEIGKVLMNTMKHNLATHSVNKNFQVSENTESHQYFFFVRQKTSRRQITC